MLIIHRGEVLFFQLIKHWPTLHPHLHLNKYLSAIAKPINITKEHTNLFSWSYTQKAKISWPGIINKGFDAIYLYFANKYFILAACTSTSKVEHFMQNCNVQFESWRRCLDFINITFNFKETKGVLHLTPRKNGVFFK